MSETAKQTPKQQVTLKIKFKSQALAQFIERYAVDVSRGGIFIRTKDPLPVGTAVKFEFQLQSGEPLIAGEGVVQWIREHDPARQGASAGMGLKFERLTPQSREILDKILAEKQKTPDAGDAFEGRTRVAGATPALGTVARPTRPVPILPALGGAAPAKKAADATPARAESSKASPLPVPGQKGGDDWNEGAFSEPTRVAPMREDLIRQMVDSVASEAPDSPAPTAATAAPPTEPVLPAPAPAVPRRAPPPAPRPEAASASAESLQAPVSGEIAPSFDVGLSLTPLKIEVAKEELAPAQPATQPIDASVADLFELGPSGAPGVEAGDAPAPASSSELDARAEASPPPLAEGSPISPVLDSKPAPESSTAAPDAPARTDDARAALPDDPTQLVDRKAAAPAPAPATAKAAKKKGSPAPWLAVGAIVVVGGGIGAYFALGSGKTTASAPQPTAQTTVPLPPPPAQVPAVAPRPDAGSPGVLVQVVSDPPGATIYVGNRNVTWVSPATVTLAPGEPTQIRIHLDGYEDFTTNVVPKAGIPVQAKLVSRPWEIKLVSVPEGAHVLLDGREIGRAPIARIFANPRELPKAAVFRTFGFLDATVPISPTAGWTYGADKNRIEIDSTLTVDPTIHHPVAEAAAPAAAVTQRPAPKPAALPAPAAAETAQQAAGAPKPEPEAAPAPKAEKPAANPPKKPDDEPAPLAPAAPAGGLKVPAWMKTGG